MLRILVATRDGVHTLDQRGHDAAVEHAGRSVTAVVRDGPELWAILDSTQVWYSPEGEWRHVASLEGVADRVVEARLAIVGDHLEAALGFCGHGIVA